MPIEIEEIIRRSEQGVTEPYICRGADEKLYFVKGKGATYDSLVKEWIAGQLARRLGLPIPRFCIVSVPRELYDVGRDGQLRDLGHGELFGSENVENTNEVSFINIQDVPTQLKRDIAAFDWWIQNGDRTLTAAGGNPNLLWSETNQALVVIDHNLAFDDEVTLHSLIETHVFSTSLSEICGHSGLKAHYGAKFEEALTDLPDILDDIPERWHYVDDDRTVEINLSLDRVETILKRHSVPAFWEQS